MWLCLGLYEKRGTCSSAKARAMVGAYVPNLGRLHYSMQWTQTSRRKGCVWYVKIRWISIVVLVMTLEFVWVFALWNYVCRFDLGEWIWLHITVHIAVADKRLGTATLCTCRKECNKYDLTAAQCFRLAHHNDWCRWFAISSPPPIWCSSFSFMGGVAKEYVTQLGCENIFSQGHILSTPGDALKGFSNVGS